MRRLRHVDFDEVWDVTARDHKCNVADSAKARLLCFLAEGPAEFGEERFAEIAKELIAQLEAFSPPDSAPVKSSVLDGSWRLASPYMGMGSAAPLDFYSRGMFTYEGGLHVGGLFAAFAADHAPDARLSALRWEIRGGAELVASAEVGVGGRSAALSYTAQLKILDRRTLSQRLESFDLPASIGSRKPLLELVRSFSVTYVDDDVMVVRHEWGVPDVLVRMPSQVPMPRSESSVTVDAPDIAVFTSAAVPVASVQGW